MKRVLLEILFPLLLFLPSCGLVKHCPPPETHTIINYVDSTVWHDSTVINYLEKERYVDIVKPLDTLYLETTYAKAEAYLDTAMTALRGSIENKSNVPVKTQIKWKERIVYRDSIVTKEIPVEVVKEVTKYPKTYWWFMGISILALVYVGVRLYLKFKLK